MTWLHDTGRANAAGRTNQSGGIWTRDGGIIVISPDVTPPSMSNLAADTVTETTAIIRCQTNESAKVRERHATTQLGLSGATPSAYTAAFAQTHEIALGGLVAATTYYYQFQAQDESGNTSDWTGGSDPVTTVATQGGGGGANDWVDSDPIAAANFAFIGTLQLSATFNSISVYQDFSETTTLEWGTDLFDYTTGDVKMEFRPSAADNSGTIRTALKPGFHRNTGETSTIAGSVLLCTAGTSYDVRLSVKGANGTWYYRTGTVTTRAENIPAYATVLAAVDAAATFVGTDGITRPRYRWVDPTAVTNGSGSQASPWNSIGNVNSGAVAGQIVVMKAGDYAPGTINKAVHLIAETVATSVATTAVGGVNRTVISSANAGSRARIVNKISSPATKTVANAGSQTSPWRKIKLSYQGGTAYDVWFLAEGGTSGLNQHVYATTTSGDTTRVPSTKSNYKAGTVTAEQFATDIHTSASHDRALWQSGTAGTVTDQTDGVTTYAYTNHSIFLWMGASFNPNDYYWWFGSVTGLTLNSATTTNPNDGNAVYRARISGVEFRALGIGISLGGASRETVVDRCFFTSCNRDISPSSQSTAPFFGLDCVIEYNLHQDQGFWSSDGNPNVTWSHVKSGWQNATDTGTLASAPGSSIEGSACYPANGGHRRLVLRYNTIRGKFNGFTAGARGSVATFSKYEGADSDFHDNYISEIPDDAMEPEQKGINIRIWNNCTRDTTTVTSLAPVDYGPIYYVRNDAFYSVRGVGYSLLGYGPGGKGFKLNREQTVEPRMYILHNTLWSDQTAPDGSPISGAEYSGTGGYHLHVMYNNLIRATKYVWDGPSGAGRYIEDYNHFATSDTGRGLQYAGQSFSAVAAYRTASGQGAHTNTAGDLVTVSVVDSRLTNPTIAGGNDLTLKAGANSFVDGGVPIPNISDRAVTDYTGTAPDLGFKERV